MAKSYEYRPTSADQFRLLTLEPSSEELDPVHCKLSIHQFSQHSDYDAISYCWGVGTDKIKIPCDGQDLEVIETTECVLKKLRHPEKAIQLWTDSICIDQRNLEERGQQVSRMNDIYRQATRVLVWLGLAYEESDRAFHLCNRLLEDERFPRIVQASQLIMPDSRVFLHRGRRELIRKKLIELESSESRQISEETPSDEATALLSNPDGRNVVNRGSSAQRRELEDIPGDDIQALYRLLKRPYWNRY